ncbi:hypothetical protein PTKIN_Ptkin17bG0082300 [Pterospermum kingtungense]
MVEFVLGDGNGMITALVKGKIHEPSKRKGQGFGIIELKVAVSTGLGFTELKAFLKVCNRGVDKVQGVKEMAFEKLTLHMHLGGTFIDKPKVAYVELMMLYGEIHVYVDHAIDKAVEVVDLDLDEAGHTVDIGQGVGSIENIQSVDHGIDLGDNVDVGHNIGDNLGGFRVNEQGGTCETLNDLVNVTVGEDKKSHVAYEDNEDNNAAAKQAKKGESSGVACDEDEGDTDLIESSDIGDYESDGQGRVVCKKRNHVFFDPSDQVPHFELGMIFEGPKQFKATLSKYSIAKRFDYKLLRNERHRTKAICKEKGCPFVIYASVDNADGMYKIKTFNSTHECSISFKNSRATYKLLAGHFLPKLRVIPDLKLHEMVELAKQELNVDVSLTVCMRARMRAKEMINGRYTYEFERLFDYVAALREADPKVDVYLIGDGDRFTITSDMQKGLCDAVLDITPKAGHRFCARHWFANWKKNHRGVELQLQFWVCLDNNHAEAFNAKIIHSRHMSIISMFEEIRHYVMRRIAKNKGICAKWTKQFCPKICEKIEHNKELNAYCHVVWNGDRRYEVVCHDDRFVVNVDKRKCTCRRWDLTGIPCCHAICVIHFRKEKVEDYVAEVYKTEVVQNCYNCVLPPIPGDKFWPATNFGPIDPPLARKLPGRPKRKRVQEEGEVSGNNFSRRGRKMRCQLCFKLNHNSRSCPEKGTQCEGSGASGSQSFNQQPQIHEHTPNEGDASEQQPSGTPHETTAMSSDQPPSVTQNQVSPLTENTPSCTGSVRGRGERGRGRGRPLKSKSNTVNRKGKDKVNDIQPPLGPRGKKIMQGWGVYTNLKTGVHILNVSFYLNLIFTFKRLLMFSMIYIADADFSGYEKEHDNASFFQELRDSLLGVKRNRSQDTVEEDLAALTSEMQGTQESNTKGKKPKKSKPVRDKNTH